MKDFTKGISNHTGPDPNRLFSGYTSAAGGGKSKKKKKGGKKPKVGIGKVENITMACEFNSDNPFVDLEVYMPQARFVMDISSDDESGKP